MTDVHVPDFCTISEVCQELGFTYYTVSYWLDNGMVRYLPAGTKKLIDMQDLNRFINEWRASHGPSIADDSSPE